MHTKLIAELPKGLLIILHGYDTIRYTQNSEEKREFVSQQREDTIELQKWKRKSRMLNK